MATDETRSTAMTQHIEHNTTLSRSAVCTLPSWNPNIKCTKAKDDVTNIIRNERINAKIEAFVYPVEDLTDLILDADLPCTNSYLGIVTFKVKQSVADACKRRPKMFRKLVLKNEKVTRGYVNTKETTSEEFMRSDAIHRLTSIYGIKIQYDDQEGVFCDGFMYQLRFLNKKLPTGMTLHSERQIVSEDKKSGDTKHKATAVKTHVETRSAPKVTTTQEAKVHCPQKAPPSSKSMQEPVNEAFVQCSGVEMAYIVKQWSRAKQFDNPDQEPKYTLKAIIDDSDSNAPKGNVKVISQDAAGLKEGQQYVEDRITILKNDANIKPFMFQTRKCKDLPEAKVEKRMDEVDLAYPGVGFFHMKMHGVYMIGPAEVSWEAFKDFNRKFKPEIKPESIQLQNYIACYIDNFDKNVMQKLASKYEIDFMMSLAGKPPRVEFLLPEDKSKVKEAIREIHSTFKTLEDNISKERISGGGVASTMLADLVQYAAKHQVVLQYNVQHDRITVAGTQKKLDKVLYGIKKAITTGYFKDQESAVAVTPTSDKEKELSSDKHTAVSDTTAPPAVSQLNTSDSQKQTCPPDDAQKPVADAQLQNTDPSSKLLPRVDDATKGMLLTATVPRNSGDIGTTGQISSPGPPSGPGDQSPERQVIADRTGVHPQDGDDRSRVAQDLAAARPKTPKTQTESKHQMLVDNWWNGHDRFKVLGSLSLSTTSQNGGGLRTTITKSDKPSTSSATLTTDSAAALPQAPSGSHVPHMNTATVTYPASSAAPQSGSKQTAPGGAQRSDQATVAATVSTLSPASTARSTPASTTRSTPASTTRSTPASTTRSTPASTGRPTPTSTTRSTSASKTATPPLRSPQTPSTVDVRPKAPTVVHASSSTVDHGTQSQFKPVTATDKPAPGVPVAPARNRRRDQKQGGTAQTKPLDHPKLTKSAEVAEEALPQVLTFQFPPNTRICTLEGDITKATTDAIVSASNWQLKAGGGVAKAIAKAAGPAFVTECAQYVKKYGTINETENAITSGGNLNARKVIHAVGPQKRDNVPMNKCLQDLRATFAKCLKTAEENRCYTIAIPAISSGNFGIPLDKAAQGMVDGVLGYLEKKQPNMSDIFLVDVRPEMVELIKHNLEQSSKLTKLDDDDVTPANGEALTATFTKPVKSKTSEDSCIVCMSPFTDPVRLSKCGHEFCHDCLVQTFTHKPECPVCKTIYGITSGNQPSSAVMKVKKEDESLPGYPSSRTIVIDYIIPSGIQKANHPNPGKWYKGTYRQAFLPNNKEGQVVLGLLKRAFEQRLVFTIGKSTTTGKDNVATWNDIHHKTQRNGGPQKFGYPDPTYLNRVKGELAAKGILAEDA